MLGGQERTRARRNPAARAGRRERDRLDRRQTIVDVAAHLFARRGYAETTLTDIAEAANVAPRTLTRYFRNKRDIAMAVTDAAIESARARILDRASEEDASQALLAWVTDGDLAGVVHRYMGALQSLPQVIAAVPTLRAVYRERQKVLEDIFAAAYARDFSETSDSMRSRIMAVIAHRGMCEVWDSWYRRHALDDRFDPTEALALHAAYLRPALAAGVSAVAPLRVDEDHVYPHADETPGKTHHLDVDPVAVATREAHKEGRV